MGCEKHKLYRGLRLTKKAQQCPQCRAFYEENIGKGKKEKRVREKKNIAKQNIAKQDIDIMDVL
jgi:hypothetical protein